MLPPKYANSVQQHKKHIYSTFNVFPKDSLITMTMITVLT